MKETQKQEVGRTVEVTEEDIREDEEKHKPVIVTEEEESQDEKEE